MIQPRRPSCRAAPGCLSYRRLLYHFANCKSLEVQSTPSCPAVTAVQCQVCTVVRRPGEASRSSAGTPTRQASELAAAEDLLTLNRGRPAPPSIVVERRVSRDGPPVSEQARKRAVSAPDMPPPLIPSWPQAPAWGGWPAPSAAFPQQYLMVPGQMPPLVYLPQFPPPPMFSSFMPQ